MIDLENKSHGGNSASRRFIFVFSGILIGAGAVFLFSKLDAREGGAVLSEAWRSAISGGERSSPAAVIPLAASVPHPNVLPDKSELDRAFADPKTPPAKTTSTAAKKKTAATGASQTKSAASAKGAPPKAAPRKEPQVSAAALTTPECDFEAPGLPDHRVLLNEIAWMGTKRDSGAEWIELKNNSGHEVDLAGWQILTSDDSLTVAFKQGDLIPAGGYFMLERKNDRTLRGIKADRIFEGTISNRGAWLKLLDDHCTLSDELNAESGWKNFGGEVSSKKTLERDHYTLRWGSSAVPGGTPRAMNNPEMVLAQAETSQPAAAPEPEPQAAAADPPEPGAAEPGTVRLNEVQAGTAANASYEFIELYNPGRGSVPLTGWSVKKKSSTGAESVLVSAAHFDGLTLGAGEYLLLANQTGYGGSAPAAVFWPSSYTLAYSNNGVSLYDPNGAKIDELAWVDLPKDKSLARRDSGEIAPGDPTPGAPNF